MINVKEGQKRSVDNLQRLYTFVVSLSVTESLRGLISSITTTGQLPTYSRVLMLVSLFVTVIPFYHGANRYLDATYVTGERAAVRMALMLDFIMLFVEGLMFFVAALLSYDENYFYTAISILFVWDVLWVLSTKFTERQTAGITNKLPHLFIWAIIDIATASLIFLFIWSNIFGRDFWSNPLAKSISLVSLSLVRTVVDYVLMWEFYYPKNVQDG